MTRQILVVDDEPDVAGFLSRLLEDNGYSTISAATGDEALRLIKEARPSLILLDLQMPHGTGTDLYRRLQSKKELRDIPIIVVSGLAGRNIAVSRSVPVIDKPIDEEKLLEEVGKALGG